MGTKLVHNVDDSIWRQFTGLCKMKGIQVGAQLSKILKEELRK